MHVSFAEAQQIINSAVKKSQELNLKMCIAVLDSGGNIKAFARMDDAWIGSSDIAIKKAKTACFFSMASGEIGKLSVPGQPLYGIEHSNEGLITFPGGVPIIDKDGNLLGAVGVSGVKSSEDAQIAKAGISALGL